jgi:tetratricopeptide (TPR) repeat protein
MGLFDKMKALRLNAKASALQEEGRLEEAESAYRAALDANSTSAEIWHNLGVLYKVQGRWQESFEALRKAVDLDASDMGYWWDLGIAATGLEDWDTARKAWKKCEVDLPEGQGPIEADMGRAAVRIRLSADSSEVVWARRVDPARAELHAVPLPMLKRRWKDIVIHDGVPSGSRKLAGKEFPVFDEIQVAEASTAPSWWWPGSVPGMPNAPCSTRPRKRDFLPPTGS